MGGLSAASQSLRVEGSTERVVITLLLLQHQHTAFLRPVRGPDSATGLDFGGWTPPHLAKNGGKRNGIGGQSLVGHSAFYLIHNRAKYAIKRRYSSDLEVHIKNTSI